MTSWSSTPSMTPKVIKRLLLSVLKTHSGKCRTRRISQWNSHYLEAQHIYGWSHSFRSYHKHPWLKPHPWIYEVWGRWSTSNSTTQKSWRPLSERPGLSEPLCRARPVPSMPLHVAAVIPAKGANQVLRADHVSTVVQHFYIEIFIGIFSLSTVTFRYSETLNLN